MQSKNPDILRGKTIAEIVAATADYVLPENFPVWTGGNVSTIKQAILRHYYMREISSETVALWRYFLSTHLLEVMPWYVDLHDRMSDMANIYLNQKDESTDTLNYGHKIGKSGTDTRTVNSTNKDTGSRSIEATDTGTVGRSTSDTGTVKNEGSNDNHMENLYSETPQNGLTSVKQGNYLTNATVEDNMNTVENTETRNLSGTNNETRNLSGTNEELRDLMQTLESTDAMSYGMTDTHSGEDVRSVVRNGFSGDKVDVLARYKELHMNIMQEIIKSCGSCWMGIIG